MPSAMALGTVALRKEKIFKVLRDDSTKIIVLVGESGVGKTSTAKEISIQAIKEGLFSTTLWIFLNREYDDDVLCQSIARQLCLLPTTEEWEPEDEKRDGDKTVESLEDLKQKISEILGEKSFLLVLDDAGKKMSEEQILSKLEPLLNLKQKSSYKILITRAKSMSETMAVNGLEPLPAKVESGIVIGVVGSLPVEDKTRVQVEVESLSTEESLSLLRERSGTEVYKVPGIERLGDLFIEKTRGLPAAIIMMAKALSYFGQQDSGLRILEGALEEASHSESFNLTQLLCSGHDKLPPSVIVDFCRSGNHFFRDHGGVHYNELIAYWIMEGYIDCTNSVEEAYEKGHCVLMELMDCQMLKKLEAGYVTMDGTLENLVNSQPFGFGETADLGLASVFDNKWEGLGRITHIDGMIKTLSRGKENQKLSTLLLDGKRLIREDLDKFFESQQELLVLALFSPNLKRLPQPMTQMNKLLVLILRGCKFLENVDQLEALKALTVLEISGAGSLNTIPGDLFNHMPLLRSVNLSALPVKSLPSSVYNLSELCWLILRGCSLLETLESLKKLSKLMVLDLSGSTSLTTIKDKTFIKNPKLRTLNLSQTRIKNLPKLPNLGELTYLSLSDCKLLDRLPSLQALASLQTLDLSGAEKFKEFHERSLGTNCGLKYLDLSETAVEQILTNISNPVHLFLRCSKLQKLPVSEALKDVQVLDLSGSIGLVEIDDNFFKELNSLRILNLSKTNIRTLPSFANLCNLRQLNLSRCSALTVLQDQSFEKMSQLETLDLSGTKIECVPSLSNLKKLRCLLLAGCTEMKRPLQIESLTELEELNLCGITSLKDFRVDFLKGMSHLQILDLSRTMLKELPSMSSLKNLKRFYLRGCLDLKTVPDLEVLTKLEVLDLSGTGLTSLPSLDNFTNLHQLLLRGCLGLEAFRGLEMNDLLGDTTKVLPYGILKLTQLQHLDLPIMQNIEEEANLYQWSISSLSADINGPRTSISDSTFFQLLKKNPSSWTSLTQFHLCIHPTEGQIGNFDKNELIFRDIHFRTREFSRFKEQRSLDIRGFNEPPKGIEAILRQTDCVFLVDNTFKRWLSALGACNLNAMKACWFERCSNMETLFHAEEAEDIAKIQGTLEALGVSNAANLKSICCDNMQLGVFQNLKSLYLDCCPKLSTLFSSSLPENLTVLQIKFCDNLETIFEQSSPEHTLANLHTLDLWELPKLKSIGCSLPAVQTLKVWGCPNLQELEETIKLAKSLRVLWISSVTDLKSVYSGDVDPENLKNLKSLTIECCPELVNVISSSQPPEYLKDLQIKSCSKLRSVFEHGTSAGYLLPNLDTLHLQELLKLERIGARLPSLRDPVLVECPNCRDYPVT